MADSQVWSVYEVDIAHKAEPFMLACIQGVRARNAEEAVARALARQGADAVHVTSRSKKTRGAKGEIVVVTISSPRRIKACTTIESIVEDAKLQSEAAIAAGTETPITVTVTEPDPGYVGAPIPEDRI